jgi:hypothetical protein
VSDLEHCHQQSYHLWNKAQSKSQHTEVSPGRQEWQYGAH